MKEKSDRQLIIRMQPSLYEEFEKKCNEEHRSISEIVRELIGRYNKNYIQMPPGTITVIK